MDQQFLKINTWTDKANFTLHALAAGALYVGMAHYSGSSLQTAFITAASFLVSAYSTRRNNASYRRMFPATHNEDLPIGSKHIPVALQVFSNQLGLTTAPELHVLPLSRIQNGHLTKKTSNKNGSGHLFAGNGPFVLSLGGGKGCVVLSERHLVKLNQKEEATIVGHETAHLASRSLEKGQFIARVGLSTAYNGYVTTALLCTSFPAILLPFSYFVFGAVNASILNRYLSATMGENEKGYTYLRKGLSCCKTGALLAASYLLGAPEVAWALGATKCAEISASIVYYSYSKHGEIQADRLAAAVSGDPRSLSSALGKLEADLSEGNPALTGNQKGDNETGIGRLFKKAMALFSTHPSLDKRRARLKYMEKRLQPSSSAAPV